MNRILIAAIFFGTLAGGCSKQPERRGDSMNYGPPGYLGGMSPSAGLGGTAGMGSWHSANPSLHPTGLLPDTVENPDGTLTYQGNVYRRK